MISRTLAVAAATACRRRRRSEGQPGRLAGPVPDAQLATRCRCSDVDRLRGDDARRSGCRWSAAWRRSTSSARRSSPCASTSIRRELASRQIGIDEVATAINTANVEPADRHAVRRPTATSSCRRTGQLIDAAGLPAGGRRLSQRQSRPPRRGRATSTTASRTTSASWFNDTPDDLPRDPAPAGHEHGRSGRRDQGDAARACRRSCRRR